jgi:hypothetical protein
MTSWSVFITCTHVQVLPVVVVGEAKRDINNADITVRSHPSKMNVMTNKSSLDVSVFDFGFAMM